MCVRACVRVCVRVHVRVRVYLCVALYACACMDVCVLMHLRALLVGLGFKRDILPSGSFFVFGAGGGEATEVTARTCTKCRENNVSTVTSGLLPRALPRIREAFPHKVFVNRNHIARAFV